jgi:hypothetical protein
MWKRAYRGAKETDSAISLGSWVYKAIDYLFLRQRGLSWVG